MMENDVFLGQKILLGNGKNLSPLKKKKRMCPLKNISSKTTRNTAYIIIILQPT